VKEKCPKTLSEYRERQCRCHVWWETVLEGGAGEWKSPFADGGEVERRYSKLVGGSRRQSLPRWHVSGWSRNFVGERGHLLLHRPHGLSFLTTCLRIL